MEWDLSEPRTAQDLGLSDGRDSAVFDRDGSEYWTARLILPGPATFTSERVIAVGVLVPGVPGGLLNSVDVQAVVDGPEQLADVLARDVEQLGLDARDVARLAQQPAPPVGGSTGGVLDGQAFGYLRSSVEVRVPEDGGRTTLSYSFTWDSSATPAPERGGHVLRADRPVRRVRQPCPRRAVPQSAEG